MLKTYIRPTQIVRSVMRSFGKTSVFTNRYSTCRTVKCYAIGSRVVMTQDERMMREITKALMEAGVQDFEVKQIASNGYSARGVGSIIVRIGFEEQA